MSRTITRQVLTTLLFSLIAASVAMAAPRPPAVEVSEESFDFGRVGQNASVSHVFWIKNVGDEMLKIADVKPGCGCTKAPLDKTDLAAGDSTRVQVTFATGHYTSTVRKSARIISNAEGHVPSLTIAADVQADMATIDNFRAQPTQFNFDADRNTGQANADEIEIALINTSSDVLSFSLVSQPDRNLTVNFPDDLTLKPGEERTVSVQFAGDISGSIFAESLTIEASDSEKTRVTIPMTKSRRWGPAPLSQLVGE